MSESPLPPHSIGIKLHTLSCLMERFAANTLARSSEFSFPQIRILAALSKHHELSQKAIAEFHGITEGAVSKMVEMLIAKKLIQRKANQKNRREKIMQLTPAGTLALKSTMQTLDRAFSKTFPQLKSDISQFASSLDELLEALRQHIKPIHSSIT